MKRSQAAPARGRGSPVPVVGIGASAGGLEALGLFFGAVPARSGLAFVVVQHLDPTHPGIMPELLRRATPMPVFQIKDRMAVKPDCVYVIPPNQDLSLLHGKLHLLEPAAPRGLRLPIDFFFRSLAEDLGERSAGVILSGMGSDGTLGLRAIKERAGGVFVQEPSSAKFDGMPSSAVSAGLADVVAPPGELPARIVAFLRREPLDVRTGADRDEKARSSREKAMLLLRLHTGHDFSCYKKSTVQRRIERRMGLHQIGRLADYVRLLRENPKETELLFKELLIGVTRFFRDPAAWDQLREEVLPALLAGPAARRQLRAWVPACGTGEEAFSLAICFREAVERVRPEGRISLQVFATDLDGDAIAKAREGLFPPNIAADISPERLSRFFLETAGGFRIAPAIRETVVFAVQNLIMEPPFNKLDILSCRNLLIYLEPELQKKLLRLFHYCLNPDGVLFLGSAESIGGFTDLFTPLGGATRIFRRTPASRWDEPVVFPSGFCPPAPLPAPPERAPAKTGEPAMNLQAEADRLILMRYAPAAVLVSPAGDVLYVSGRTGAYLEPAAGKANWNIFAMARQGLREVLGGTLRKVLRTGVEVTVRDVPVDNAGRGVQPTDVTVRLVAEPEALRGMVLILFADAVAPARGGAASASATRALAAPRPPREPTEAERDLAEARERMRSTNEELQSTNEELQSANEELQSTNEELQSTNEELTVSREEMQSMNEELQTLNSELQAKVDELSSVQNDMKNLLDSTGIATIFLDGALVLRRFTTEAASIARLIPGDVGRPITDLSSGLFYPGLSGDVSEVLKSLNSVEREIPLPDGRWYAARVLPYRTLDDRIEGVVVTLRDITRAKTLELELRKVKAALEVRVSRQEAALARSGERTGIRKPRGGKARGGPSERKRDEP